MAVPRLTMDDAGAMAYRSCDADRGVWLTSDVPMEDVWNWPV